MMLAFLAVLFLLMTLIHLLHFLQRTPTVGLLWNRGTHCGCRARLFARLIAIGTTLRLWPFRTFYSLKEDAKWIKEQLLSTKT